MTTVPGATNTSSGSKATQAGNRLNDDFNMFLKLFTTQLQNQDPMEPMDSGQMATLTSQMTMAEQAVATNQNLEKLIALTGATQINNAVSYIGKRIETIGNKGTLENQNALFVYDLESNADDVQFVIKDASGRTVYEGQGSKNGGRNEVYWDGINSGTGEQEPDGIYTFNVMAKTADGKVVKNTSYTSVRVTAASFENDEIMLSFGNLNFPLADVVKVREDPFYF